MSFLSRIKKIFSWIKFLWKIDDGSYISLYFVIVKQLNDMQTEFMKYADMFPTAIDFCLQAEEVKNNLKLAISSNEAEKTKMLCGRALNIIKEYSYDWWI